MHIRAVGLVCPVGLSASAACAAMRAGIARFQELPYWDRNSAPVVGAAVHGLTFDLQFGPRLVEMLAGALQDCLSDIPALPFQKVPLLVGLPESGRPGGGVGSTEGIIAGVQERLDIKFHREFSKGIPTGHTAGFECLRAAREILKTTDLPGCLVCGVDSYINASSLFWLDQHWRLKCEGHRDGVIPGEAAAAIYVRREATSGATGEATIAGLGFANEDAPVLSEQPLLGRGLAEAARNALAEAGWGFHQLDFRLSDVTGENYGFREHTLTRGRLLRVVPLRDQPLWHPADSIGDTGAAAGIVQLIRATVAWEKAYAPGKRAACFTSAVSGDRAVATIYWGNEF